MRFGKGQCEGRVSNDTSRVMGKARCNNAAKYFMGGKNLCTRCTTKAKSIAYGQLVMLLKCPPWRWPSAETLLRELGEDE